METDQPTGMTRRRALLTDRERELIANEPGIEKGEHFDEYRYQAISRTRNKIHEELTQDLEILRENHPELFNELQEVVCDID